MANNSLLTFFAGAAAGAALALYLKSDKEKLSVVLDKVEDFLDKHDCKTRPDTTPDGESMDWEAEAAATAEETAAEPAEETAEENADEDKEA